LGNGDWTLDDLNSVERPLRSNDLTAALRGAVYNILWSDPVEPDSKDPVKNYGVHPSHRAKHSTVMKQFGRDVTERFCAREELGMVIRSHQFRRSGKGYELQHDGWLMRVFSARNYCGVSSNDGGLLLIGRTEGKPGTLLVRPQNIERMPRQAKPQGAESSEEAPEPYCERGHLMQLVEPAPQHRRVSLSRMCGDLETNVECNKCGAEELQVGRFFNCRGCGHYDLCLACAALGPDAVAEPVDDSDASEDGDDSNICFPEGGDGEVVAEPVVPGTGDTLGDSPREVAPAVAPPTPGPCLLTHRAREPGRKPGADLEI